MEKQTANRQPATLKRLWELESRLRCPVIGACLTVSEHAALLKKVFAQSRKLRPYQMHGTVMDHLDDENRLSVKLDKYLRHKYRRAVADLAELDEEAFMEVWQRSFGKGEMEGVLFVAALRNDLSAASMGEIFGETHMLCHANLKEVMEARKGLAFQEEANRKMARVLAQEKKRSSERKRENREIRASLKEALRKAEQRKRSRPGAQPEVTRATEGLRAESQALKQRMVEMEAQLRELEFRLRRADKEQKRLEKEKADLEAVHQSLSDEVAGLICPPVDADRSMAACGGDCPRPSLCARKILVVGGLTKMKPLYKRLVESNGGLFDYHDGYMKQGKQELDSQVRRADLILCPVSCNSHGACLAVKQLCRKYGKPARMLSSPSLSAISRGLFAGNEGAQLRM